jgi:hypothetical protein
MCYNAPVSFTTFFVGMYIAYELWSRKKEEAYEKKYDYWNSLFVVSFILMQLAEGFAWLGYDIAKYFIIYIVGLQPIVQSFGNAYFNGQPLFYIPVIIGFLLLSFVRNPEKISAGINGHLNWSVKFDNVFIALLCLSYYFIFISLPMLWQVPLKRYIILGIYGVLTLLWSLYNYQISGEFSSMWCFLAIGYAILAYIVNMKPKVVQEPKVDLYHKSF